MNENIQNFLGWQHWDLCKNVKKVPITKFIDPLDGVWDPVAPKAPCGCVPESGENAFRFWMWCPKHLEVGILIYAYRENRWFWISGNLEEVTKK
jgi:hypothetical protein